jgi:very-short-patch-repair endonuclease
MQRVKPRQTERARRLRAEMTDAEHKLWRAIRQSQLGVKFRRQHPIDCFIVDFACLEPKVVVEIDGGQHVDDAQRDEERTRKIEAHDFRVIRFLE